MASSAVLEAIGGSETVTVKRAGKSLKLRQGESLEPGDEVVTDSRTAVDVRMEDRTLIRVGANSTYKLEEDSKAKRLFHRLLNGIVRVMVPARPEGRNGDVRFRMNTPEGTIGVRGTEFVVIRGKDETTLKGLQGEVLFGPENAEFDSAGFVQVQGGFQSSVRKGGTPSPPRGFNVPDYLKELSGRRGGFGGLSARAPNVRTRTPVADKPQPALAAAPKEAPRPRPSAGAKMATTAPSRAAVTPDEMLFRAAGEGDLKRAQEALAKGAKVNYQDELGHTPLHMATLHGQVEMVRFLKEKDADLNARNKQGETPLMYAASEAKEPTLMAAMFLLESGARAREKNRSGATALDLARRELKKATDATTREQLQELIQALEEKLNSE